MQEEEVGPYQLISAQLQVVKCMEDNWYVIIVLMAVVPLNYCMVCRFQKYLRSLRRGGFFKLESIKQPTSNGFRQKNHVVCIVYYFTKVIGGHNNNKLMFHGLFSLQ